MQDLIATIKKRMNAERDALASFRRHIDENPRYAFETCSQSAMQNVVRQEVFGRMLWCAQRVRDGKMTVEEAVGHLDDLANSAIGDSFRTSTSPMANIFDTITADVWHREWFVGAMGIGGGYRSRFRKNG